MGHKGLVEHRRCHQAQVRAPQQGTPGTRLRWAPRLELGSRWRHGLHHGPDLRCANQCTHA